MTGQPLQGLGQMLMIGGAVLLAVGAVLYFGGNFGPLGKLPGDIRIEGKSGGFYFPIVTCLVVSLVLSLLAMLVRR